MKIGVIRVSTDEQNYELQLDALNAAGCERIFEDQAGGRSANRPGLDEALAFARSGDVIVCWKLDRLGRSTRRLVELLYEIRSRGVEFQSITEGIDTTTTIGRLFYHFIAALAEMELDLIHERTHAGLRAARARGRVGGRKPLPDATIASIRQLAASPDAVVKDVCQSLGISRATFYKYATPGEQVAPPAEPAAARRRSKKTG